MITVQSLASNAILKTFSTHEFFYYYIVNKKFKELLPYIPKFLGVVKKVDGKEEHFEKLDIDELFDKYKTSIDLEPTRDHSLFIVIGDGRVGMQQPCSLDVKMGKSLLHFWASGERQHEFDEKCKKSTSAKHCMRLDGAIYYMENASKELELKNISKKSTFTLSFEQMKSIMREFYSCPKNVLDVDLILRVKAEVSAILEAFSLHECYAFYCSSLLVIYDLYDHSKVFVKLIDFDHVTSLQILGEKHDPNLHDALVAYMDLLDSLVEEESAPA